MKSKTANLLTFAGLALSFLPAAASAQVFCDAWIPVVPPTPVLAAPIRAALQWDPDGAGGNPAVVLFAGGIATTRPTQWDGTTFTQFGTALSGAITDMTIFNGELVVAGTFTTTAGGPVGLLNRIARWDPTTSTWQPFGSGFASGAVNALAVHNGELYAGGTFLASGTTTVNGVARFDATSSTWQPLANGTVVGIGTGAVNALHSHGGELIVGGTFATAGGVSSPSIVRWTGTAWEPFAQNLLASAQTVNALATYNGELVVGGGFAGPSRTFPEVQVVNNARWTGATWEVLGLQFNPSINTFGFFGSSLIAGGTFTSLQFPASAFGTNRVARFDGTEWTPLLGGSSSTIDAVLEFNGDLIVAGSPTQFNHTFNLEGLAGISARFVGRYRPNAEVTIADQPDSASVSCGATVVFTANASAAYKNLTWRWEKVGSGVITNGPLTDGGGTAAITAFGNTNLVSGINTRLTITGTSAAAAGSYRAVLITECGEVASTDAVLTMLCRCNPADIAFDDGSPLPPIGVSGGTNNGVTEGDYNLFFATFFDAGAACDIANDDSSPLPPFGTLQTNNGVTEGDYNLFFAIYFDGCAF
jgi:hypothetical protein